MSFVISGIPAEPFEALFGMSAAELNAQGILRKQVDCQPGYPCRITLEDAAVGEHVLLLNYVSHRVESPYRSSFAIYVREGATQSARFFDALPPVMIGRPIALRFFDSEGSLVGADLCLGKGLERKINAALSLPGVEYLHAHNAAHGCFAAEVRRAA